MSYDAQNVILSGRQQSLPMDQRTLQTITEMSSHQAERTRLVCPLSRAGQEATLLTMSTLGGGTRELTFGNGFTTANRL
jgi:hypothetical protein